MKRNLSERVGTIEEELAALRADVRVIRKLMGFAIVALGGPPVLSALASSF